MPNNWRTYKLGDLIRIKHGFAFKGEFFSDEKNDNVLLTPGNFNSYGGIKFNWEKQKFYKGEFPVDYILNQGDLIIALTDLTQSCSILGSTAIIKDNDYTYLHNQRLGLVKDLNSKVNSNFLYYIFNDSSFRNHVIATKTGSTVSHTAPERIYNYEINIPENLPEQQSIASILSAIDDKIENNLAINKTLEEMAMTLYKHWFVDFGPFQNGEFVDSELGRIPKGWEVKKFNDLIESIIDNRGKTPPLSSEKTNFLLLETYQLSRNNLFPNVLKDNKAKYVSEEIYNTKKWFRKGHPKFMDILFATVGNGIPNWSLMYENEGVCIAQNIVAIRPKENISSFFLRYSFESTRFLDQFDGYVITTAQPSIKLSDLNRINMLLPSAENLKEWDIIVSEYVKQVFNNYKENQTLTQLRDTLLPKLISGEVRLKEFRASE